MSAAQRNGEVLNLLAARAVALQHFEQIPDDCLVGYRELAVLTNRSEDTLRQAKRLGKLPIPRHPSSSRIVQFTVRDVRKFLRGEIPA